MQAFGGLDILVNNAGIAIGAQFEETTDEQWDRILGINVTAIFRISKAAVPHLRARGGGRIINLGSIMSNTAGPSLAAYGTTKHAVAGLSKGMAVDLGKYKITVNYLQPGSIWTALSQPFFDDPNSAKYWEAKAPMGRIGDPEDVAAAACSWRRTRRNSSRVRASRWTAAQPSTSDAPTQARRKRKGACLRKPLEFVAPTPGFEPGTR